MKLNIYTIFDSAAQAHLSPMFMLNDGIALRWFSDGINREGTKNNLFNHPEQFTLFKVGTWDDSTCQFELLDTPKSLGIGVEYRDPQISIIEQIKNLLGENQ
jgi:hypothetical protein